VGADLSVTLAPGWPHRAAPSTRPPRARDALYRGVPGRVDDEGVGLLAAAFGDDSDSEKTLVAGSWAFRASRRIVSFVIFVAFVSERDAVARVSVPRQSRPTGNPG
jgi:hypothetical protein